MSVAGKSLKDTSPVEIAQPVILVGSNGVSSANADGSQDIAGANGTSVATQANPLPTSTNGVNGTGIATGINPFPTRDYGGGTMATGQISVGTGNTQVVAARTSRMSVTITNLGTGVVYLGNTGVLSTTGMLLPGVVGASITIPTQTAVFGIAPVAQSVAFLETY